MQPGSLAEAIARTLAQWTAERRVARLWTKDASLWTSSGEEKWLGWLDVIEAQRRELGARTALADAIRTEGITDVLLLGMGGSSLGPEVVFRVIGGATGAPRLHVLDSTDPAQVKRFDDAVDLRSTLVLVASKSGSTLEPNVFLAYFFDRLKQVVGEAEAGRHVVAITDPGSQMQKVAERDGFRAIAFGEPTVGGRFSVLSAFGTVPAALSGVDVACLLDEAAQMADACRSEDAATNPGVALGVVIGEAAKAGRDKLTILASPGIAPLGAWLEQLVAESTGKNGTAVIPVDLEPRGDASTYGSDRLFVYLRLAADADADQDAFVEQLNHAGQPVVKIDVRDTYALGQEFFRWEIATAVAGAVLGINPFDQPDVEASKIKTRALTDAFEQEGALPAEAPVVLDTEMAIFTDEANVRALGPVATPVEAIAAHLRRVVAGDYVALLAYIDMTTDNIAALQEIRAVIRAQAGTATCLGFGPRFLHSTGQAYKGGPDSGVFLQITCDDAVDVQVPGRAFTFGVVKAAQARGDFGVLEERGRRALRVHLGADVAAGLQALRSAVEGTYQ
ncbi:Glucose-6-phosphate isomerase [Luteitalea pratensis]|uniref:Glucose-6-phosphate isomerase n=1 Tax=Luteitalea pratensis TaxID=1855912 RepID=A0A143PML2_LUTPR|nr:Glucose-6-phosphate isomerase [Luteitalea pratensis]